MEKKINLHVQEQADGRYIYVFQCSLRHYLVADWVPVVGSTFQDEGNNL